MSVSRSYIDENLFPYCRYFGTVGLLGFTCVTLADVVAQRTLPEILSAYRTEAPALSRVEKNALWKFTAAANRVPRNQSVNAIKVPQQPLHVLVANLERAEQSLSVDGTTEANTVAAMTTGSAVLAASCESPDQYVYCVIPGGTGTAADVLRFPATVVTKSKASRVTAVTRRSRKAKPVIIAEVTADIIMRNIKGPS